MAVPRSWLPRIGDILMLLSADFSNEYDRAAIETLFQVSRRTAIKILTAAGVDAQQGKPMHITRIGLLEWVQKINASEAQELERRKATAAAITKSVRNWGSVRHHASKTEGGTGDFRLLEEVRNTTFASLPREISIGQGFIRVDFNKDNPEEALQLLYTLGLALTNDLATFRRIVKGKAASKETALDDFLLSLESDKQNGIID